MKGVVHVEVVMMTGDGHDETRPVVFDIRHQCIRIPFFRLEQRDQILIAKLFERSVMFYVPLGQSLVHAQVFIRLTLGRRRVHAASVVRSIVRTVFIGGG